jgi:hypothetical protein
MNSDVLSISNIIVGITCLVSFLLMEKKTGKALLIFHPVTIRERYREVLLSGLYGRLRCSEIHVGSPQIPLCVNHVSGIICKLSVRKHINLQHYIAAATALAFMSERIHCPIDFRNMALLVSLAEEACGEGVTRQCMNVGVVQI